MSENQIKISYKPLWKLLIDRDMTKTELRCGFDDVVQIESGK